MRVGLPGIGFLSMAKNDDVANDLRQVHNGPTVFFVEPQPHSSTPPRLIADAHDAPKNFPVHSEKTHQ